MLVSTMFAQRDADVRRGYRLHITNLEDRAFTYSVRYCVTPPTSEARWAGVLNQFFNLYSGLDGGIASIDLPSFHRMGSVYISTTSFVVEPNHTMSVGITPGERSPTVEGVHLLEGYVTLELPVVRGGQGDLRFRSVPQTDGPVRVLLNPETTMIHTDTSRGGYTQGIGGVMTGRVSVTRLNFDTVEPLIPASGKAENQVTPNGRLLMTQDALVEAVQASQPVEAGAFVGAENLPVADRMGMLIELLCELDPQEEFLVELNKVLSKNLAAVMVRQNKS